MTPPREQDEEPPVSSEALLAFFTAAEHPDPSTHRIGTEMEKFGVVVDRATGLLEPVRYAEHVLPVLTALQRDFGWEPIHSGTDGAVVELRRDSASITLEPGGQLELSGRPQPNAHDNRRELMLHQHELHAVSEPLGITWLAAGFHPFARREEFDWMPKGRYAVMRRYLATRGAKAHDMMLRTSTVQANLDFASQSQCGERFRLALAVGPIVAALFANSPLEEGKASGRRTLRPSVWAEVDPDRCGIPRALFEQRFSYRAYVEWALDVPMFFVRRGDGYHPFHRSFREYMAVGFVDPDGRHHHATASDWQLHLSTVFPEVRLKPFVEVRQADAGSLELACALPALWKGLLYDPESVAEATLRFGDVPWQRLVEDWQRAGTEGLAAPDLRAAAETLLELARAGLDRADVRDDRGRTEAWLLEPLVARVASGRSPADETLAVLGTEPGRSAEGRRAIARHYWFAGARP